MELSDLKMFLAIIEQGSITRAAEKLGYVQSNITMRIRKLESELGVQLFHRNVKGVAPTEKGLLFKKHVMDILNRVDEAVMDVKEPDYPCGPLSIGVVETMASSASFIRALSVFQTKYPKVELSLITGTSPQNYEKLLSRQLDGAFLTGEFDLSPMHVAHELREEVVLVTAAGSNSPEVTNASWVVFPKGCPLRAAAEDWLRVNGVSSANVIEVSTLETLLNCVRAGIGCSMLTRPSVDENDDRVRVYPVPEKYRFATTRLVSRKEQFASKAFNAFAECIRGAAV
ncbi:LysR family transcriptional regulator [Paenibacillus alkalitolerans]|uniref:LysR family transcriptional regulator n=1 Tax=Paenibacillus alkalitolerans TaxID=2799335 RepID=UPI0018F5D645|nr:LysR family transcriptional regulator [Paenibacillus alkalitolerans]